MDGLNLFNHLSLLRNCLSFLVVVSTVLTISLSLNLMTLNFAYSIAMVVKKTECPFPSGLQPSITGLEMKSGLRGNRQGHATGHSGCCLDFAGGGNTNLNFFEAFHCFMFV